MKLRRIFLSVILGLMILAPALKLGGHHAGTTYYVDATLGKDTYNGTTSTIDDGAGEGPFKTIAKVISGTPSLAAGDSVLFKRGETWREQLTVPSSGSSGAGNTITFGKYGTTGADPIITGADIVTDFAAYSAWVTAQDVTTNSEFTDDAGSKNYRNTIAAGTSSFDGSKVRITLTASATKNATVGGTSIGLMTTGPDFDAAPTRITWNTGSSTATVTAGNSLVSDEITFVFDKTLRYGIHLYTNLRNFKYYNSGTSHYFEGTATDRTMTEDVTMSASGAFWIDKVEVYSTTANVYTKTGLTTTINYVWFDGAVGTKKASIATLASNNDWYYDAAADILYIYSTSDPAGRTVEAGQRNTCVATWNKSCVTVDGLKVRGSNSTYYGAIHFDGQDNAAGNNTVVNCTADLFGSWGITAYSADNITISANTITSSGSAGCISITEGTPAAACDSLIISDNILSGSGYGILSPTEKTLNIHTATISGNTISNMTVSAITLNYCDHLTIDGNTIATSGAAGDYSAIHVGMACPNSIVRFNSVDGAKDSGGVGGHGIQIDTDSDNSQVYYNICLNCDGGAVSVIDAVNVAIYNNTGYNNGLVSTAGGGVSLLGPVQDATTGIVKNNVMYASNNSYAIRVDAATSNNDIAITNNCWYKASGNWYYYNVTAGATLATWNALTGVGTDLNSDPLFVTNGSDFHLQSGSPCRNTGVDVGLTTDYAGNAIGLVPDIGAYEYAVVVPTLAATTAASAIAATTATSGGDVTDDGGATITARGICWGTSANPTTSGSKTTESGTTGAFTSAITGLSPGVTYHLRAYATNSAGSGYGTDVSFTTLAAAKFAVLMMLLGIRKA